MSPQQPIARSKPAGTGGLSRHASVEGLGLLLINPRLHGSRDLSVMTSE